jgi:hypothetical protein
MAEFCCTWEDQLSLETQIIGRLLSTDATYYDKGYSVARYTTGL